jgi:TonB family protein
MSDTLNQWEGQIVNGKFPLLRYLGGSEGRAVYLTERVEGERHIKAAIKLLPETPENGELQLSRWREAGKLSHPHLITLYEMGRCDLGGLALIYVVMECAEENLAQVLPARALTNEEARAMLDSVLDVLAYLHGKGYVHGHIKPANIMASGDELKVSSDGLRRAGASLDSLDRQDAYLAPENTRGLLPTPPQMSPEGDVWSLGMTLVETLTQNLPVARTAEDQDPKFPRTMQEPFLEIASHCLLRQPQNRWTIPQIAERLKGRGPVRQVSVVVPKAQTQVRPPRPITRQSKPPVKWKKYATPIAIGGTLVMAAILFGPRSLRRNTESPQLISTADERPLVPPPPAKAAPAPQKDPIKTTKPALTVKEQSPKNIPPMPASIHPVTVHEEEPPVAKGSGSALIRGDVVHQVMPEVLQSARNTIRGKVRVSVKVNVDRQGDVEDAELESRGPSKYFARAALQAAQLWKFKPPKTGNQGVLSSWTLQFEFTRDETTAVPTQDLP